MQEPFQLGVWWSWQCRGIARKKSNTSRHCTTQSKVGSQHRKWVLLLSCAHIHTCTDGYNQYVRLSGDTTSTGPCSALRKGKKIYTISDNTPLLHFLSGKLMTGLIAITY